MSEGFTLNLTRDAAGHYERADRATARRLNRCFAQFEVDPFVGDVRPIAGRPGVWRCRVGGLRVLFDVDLPARVVTVYAILPRGDAYRRRRR